MKKNPRFSSLGASGASCNYLCDSSSLTGPPVLWEIRCLVRRPIVLRLPGSSGYLPHIRNHSLSGVVMCLGRICLGRIQRSHRKPTGYRHRWPCRRYLGWHRLLYPQGWVAHINHKFHGRIRYSKCLVCNCTVIELPHCSVLRGSHLIATPRLGNYVFNF